MIKYESAFMTFSKTQLNFTYALVDLCSASQVVFEDSRKLDDNTQNVQTMVSNLADWAYPIDGKC